MKSALIFSGCYAVLTLIATGIFALFGAASIAVNIFIVGFLFVAIFKGIATANFFVFLWRRRKVQDGED